MKIDDDDFQRADTAQPAYGGSFLSADSGPHTSINQKWATDDPGDNYVVEEFNSLGGLRSDFYDQIQDRLKEL